MKIISRSIAIVTFAVVLMMETAEAQPLESRRFFIAGGLASPAVPQTFYDYWRMGPSVSGGLWFRSSEAMYYGAEGELAYFPLDRDRYLKGLRIPSGTGSVDGGGSLIVLLGGLVGITTTDPREYAQMSGDVGLGVQSSIVGRSTGTFSGISMESDGSFRMALVASAAGRVVIMKAGPWRVAAEGRYRLRLLGDGLANAGYSSIRIHVSRPIGDE